MRAQARNVLRIPQPPLPPSFRDAPLGAGPESIIPIRGYGFRARCLASPRNLGVRIILSTCDRTLLHSGAMPSIEDLKSTRLDSSHTVLPYAVFCSQQNSI